VILNLQRACEAAIHLAIHLVLKVNMVRTNQVRRLCIVG